MRRYGLLVVAVIGLLMGQRPAHAGPSCVAIDVGIDASHSLVSIDLTLPKGLDTLPLEPFDGYRRSEVLRSPNGSAVISGDAVHVADPQQRHLRLSMDVSANVPQRDRAYAPFLRFADGTVALDSDFLRGAKNLSPTCLRFVPAARQEVVGFGVASPKPLTEPGDGSASGYVAFGTPRVASRPLRVTDRTAPAWAQLRLDNAIHRLTTFYRQRLGPAAMPTVFIYRLPNPPGGTGIGYHGDRLPGSLTLGLLGSERDWQAPNPAMLELLTGFAAHEMFHVWNMGGDIQPGDTDSNLASEGGAELARIFATAELQGRGKGDWSSAVTDSLDACLAILPASGSLADHLEHGRPAYDCGVPIMLALGAVNDPHDPVAGYFNAWKALIEKRRSAADHYYRWTELASTAADPRVLADLQRAMHDDGAYPAAISHALTLTGFVITPNHRPSADLRRQLNAQMMTALMAQDCAGRVDLWNQPEGFRIGPHAPSCRNLQAGRIVTALVGIRLADDDPASLHSAIAVRCAKGGDIAVTYADGTAPAHLACPAHLPPAPALLRIETPSSALSRRDDASGGVPRYSSVYTFNDTTRALLKSPTNEGCLT